MNRNELNDRICAIEKLAEDNHIWADFCGEFHTSLFDVIDFRIDRGDWKHDHIRFDLIIKDNFDDVYKIVQKDYDEDGSDCYGSTHSIYIVSDSNKELVDQISALFNR